MNVQGIGSYQQNYNNPAFKAKAIINAQNVNAGAIVAMGAAELGGAVSTRRGSDIVFDFKKASLEQVKTFIEGLNPPKRANVRFEA